MEIEVYRLLRKVPEGKVTTYKELARAAKTHPRAVGMLMRLNKDPLNIPCYKVVRSDGSLGGYSPDRGIQEKKRLLEEDGVEVKNSKVDLKKHLHTF